jgi:hypothetical protein
MSNNPNMGRPSLKYDLAQVQLFGRFRATYESMADWYECDVRTIERLMSPSQETPTDFCRAYKRGQADLKLKLSEAQVHNAIVNENATLQIWLGKQYLDQVDKREVDQNIKADVRTTAVDLTLLAPDKLAQLKEILSEAEDNDE